MIHVFSQDSALPRNLPSQVREFLLAAADADDTTGGSVESKAAVGFGLVLSGGPAPVRVLEVRKNGPAEVAGVQVGDELIRINDQLLSKPEALFDVTDRMSVADRALLTVRRGNDERRFDVVASTDETARDSILPHETVKATRVRRDDVDAPSVKTEVVPPVKLGATLETKAEGIAIVRIDEVSPLRDAGMRPGDLIKTAAGHGVATPEGLFRILNRFDAGANVEITVKRDEEEKKFTITLPNDHEKVLVDPDANSTSDDHSTSITIRGNRFSANELLEQILANQQRQQAQLNYLYEAMQRLAQAAGVKESVLGTPVFGLGGMVGGNAAGSNCYCAIGSNPQGNPVIGFTQTGQAVAVVSRNAMQVPILAETVLAVPGKPDVANDGLNNTDQNGDGLPDGADLNGDGFPSAANANAGVKDSCFCPIGTDPSGKPIVGVTRQEIPVAVVGTDANGHPLLAETRLAPTGSSGAGAKAETIHPQVPIPDPPIARPLRTPGKR
ncbi:MAG: PDZ domain-containing protein [Planctomycetaceae bacterium]